MRKENKNGFTLVEGLVAIAILVLVITFVLNVIQGSLKPLAHSQAQIVASFLAQETIETVRNIRDENFLKGRNWLYGLDECIVGVCRISIFSYPRVDLCTDGTCGKLRYDTETGRYGYESEWIESEFTRETEIDENPYFGRATVSVTVRWSTGELIMKETLYEFQ